ncbi:MAG: uracil-DNA glycosylase, partial [Anaerolineales bacterium]|nr:uracil-DNA glycosylase [Anaerolineales bacterium]
MENLESLHARIHACRLCLDAGHDIFPRPIFSGSLGARIMSIGQAPGITEKEAGRPFNAGSGTRLFQWLAKAGIDETWYRANQYMSSVTKCYPGRAKSGTGDRVPSPAEQALCRPFLDAEIRLVNPELIIPIGKLAIELVYPKGVALSDIIGTEKEMD